MHNDFNILVDKSDGLEFDTSSRAQAEDDFKEQAIRRLGVESSGYINLIFAIINNAASAGHGEYFAGHKFKYHCYLLGIDHEDLLQSMLLKKLGGAPLKRKRNFQLIQDLGGEIREKYKTGRYTQQTLAEMYVVRVGDVAKLLKDLKVGYGRDRPPHFKDDVIALRRSGATMKQVSRHFHVRNEEIRAILTPLGLNIRRVTKKKYHLGG